jgi:hypothetical protein
LANVYSSVLCKLSGGIKRLAAAGADLYVSGFDVSQKAEVLESFRRCGAVLVEEKTASGEDGGQKWCALRLQLP